MKVRYVSPILTECLWGGTDVSCPRGLMSVGFCACAAATDVAVLRVDDSFQRRDLPHVHGSELSRGQDGLRCRGKQLPSGGHCF